MITSSDVTVDSTENVGLNTLRLVQELSPKLTSSSPTNHRALQQMFTVFVDAYGRTPQGVLTLIDSDRLDFAVHAAIRQQPSRHLAAHFTKLVRSAHQNLPVAAPSLAQAS